LTTWHCIFSAELSKTHSFRLLLWRFCPMPNIIFEHIDIIGLKFTLFMLLSLNFDGSDGKAFFQNQKESFIKCKRQLG